MPLLPKEPPLSSKKWLAFLISEITWKGLLAYGIFQGLDAATLMMMVGAAGAVEGAYLGFQAYQDKAVKTAAMQVPAGSTGE